MGWSCAAQADETLKTWTEFCVATSGMSNTYKDDGRTYFFEVSRTEHADGRITGQIFRMLDGSMCKPVCRFRINADGTIERAPAVLCKLRAEARAA